MKSDAGRRERFLAAVRDGMTLTEAAAHVVVSRRTAQDALARGRAGDPALAEFAQAVDAARDPREPLDEHDLVELLEAAARRGSGGHAA